MRIPIPSPGPFVRWRATRVPIVALLLQLVAWPLEADPATWICSPASVFREIVDGEPRVVARAEEIPAEILEAIGIPDAWLANPGESWNSGCIPTDDAPDAMLVFAARTSRVWVVHTRHGGFAVFERTTVVCSEAAGLHVYRVWPPLPKTDEERSTFTTSFRSFAELRRVIRPEWIVSAEKR